MALQDSEGTESMRLDPQRVQTLCENLAQVLGRVNSASKDKTVCMHHL